MSQINYTPMSLNMILRQDNEKLVTLTCNKSSTGNFVCQMKPTPTNNDFKFNSIGSENLSKYSKYS